MFFGFHYSGVSTLKGIMMEGCNKRFLIYSATLLRKAASKIDELLKQEDTPPASKYTALTPSKIEGPNEYFTAMDYALSQKDVRNIAVTGAYGAGKSTIISSYMDTFSKGRHISVSLAGFDMEKKGDPKPQEVELSILQQILYKENSDALPDSRIDRILNRNGRHIRRVFFSALKLAVPLCLLLALIFPDKALSIAGIPASIVTWFNWAVPYKLFFVLLSFGFSLYCISAFTSRIGIFDKKIKLNKISLLSGEVETGSGESSSLLNNCLDEMVYFFSKIQDYRIVVFEDLDRLKDHDIFVKLREINTIINNNLSEDNPLRFIYAVRDDVFPGAESRTKFFDFIIPVVPVMDVRNAYSLLNDKLGGSVAGIQECLRGTAMYINDMRCLQNIVNEYLIFESVVDNNKRKVNLYSLVFYKNTFSHDYGLIDREISVLYRFVDDYRHLRLHDEHFLNLNERVTFLSSKLNEIIIEYASTSQDVRKNILDSLIPEKLNNIVSFQNSSNNYSWNSYDKNFLVNDENSFIEFLEYKAAIRIGSINDSHGYSTSNAYDLSKPERDTLLSDYQRRKILIGDDRSQALEKAKSDLAEAKEKQRRKKAISLSGLVSLMTLEQFSARAEGYLNALDTHTFLSEDKRKLIRDEMRYGGTEALYLLLSRGFLDQDFMRSRSVFHEGGLSVNDNEFIKQIPLGLSFGESNDKFVIDDVGGGSQRYHCSAFTSLRSSTASSNPCSPAPERRQQP
ncbi:YobI family P-loop NTPase [Erwinia sp. MYb535]|uniref:YobI family P-loop NTPase n=1 Tax=Erwinia sp. MYb535 TaxID=2745309 RepID=UPI0030AC5454